MIEKTQQFALFKPHTFTRLFKKIDCEMPIIDKIVHVINALCKVRDHAKRHKNDVLQKKLRKILSRANYDYVCTDGDNKHQGEFTGYFRRMAPFILNAQYPKFA